MSFARAQVLVNTGAIVNNYATIAQRAGVKAMAVVKADAYGHGVSHVAPALRAHGVEWLGVALPAEALALRASGDTGNVLSWLSTPGDPAIAQCVVGGIDLSVSSTRELNEISQAAQAAGVTANIHLKVDTGLSRNGVMISNLPELIDDLLPAVHDGSVHLRGVWTHLASADDENIALAESSVHSQIDIFDHALSLLAGAGLNPDIRHMGNTAAALWHPSAHYDLVRVGIGLYGLSPNQGRETSSDLGITPAMTVSAHLSNVKTIPAGSGVSYSHAWIAPEATRVGLVPVGYADGIPRSASSLVDLAINGQLVPQVGRIAMDQCVIDLSDHPNAQAGDAVTLFGPGLAGELTADQWADRTGTIGYEIVTRIGVRIPKDYV
jgi:alanine racemase